MVEDEEVEEDDVEDEEDEEECLGVHALPSPHLHTPTLQLC